MSFALDVNVLLYASDQQSPHHETALDVLRQCVAGSEVFYLPWPALMAYLRIATHPGVFTAPLSPAEAAANVTALLDAPLARTLAEGPRFWSCYQEIAKPLRVRGNLVPDAHLAALLLEHGVRDLVTHDADFRKFTFLRVVDPFS